MMKEMLVAVVILTGAGCSKLQYLDQALALRALATEKDAQADYVKDHDERFELLRQQFDGKQPLKGYTLKKDVAAVFGDPIFCRQQGNLEKCLFRRINKPEASPRFYLYFRG